MVLLPRVSEHPLRRGCRPLWQPRLLVGVADGQDDVRVEACGGEDSPEGKDEGLESGFRGLHEAPVLGRPGLRQNLSFHAGMGHV